MPTVKLNLDSAGRGDLVVDGARLSCITSGVTIVSAAGEATKVTVDIGFCKLEEIEIEGADLIIKGESIPGSVQSALYEFLRGKYDQVDVTVLSDESRKFAVRGD